jgi:hypothetical protein
MVEAQGIGVLIARNGVLAQVVEFTPGGLEPNRPTMVASYYQAFLLPKHFWSRAWALWMAGAEPEATIACRHQAGVDRCRRSQSNLRNLAYNSLR